ncbi:Glutaryl-CoA dehydrogenase [Corynebacterium glyciniphilum AJ 3170]|uniref:Glutaryl-CoA dehydrogenase n=1 Tax=Corynebacterium glyciniphilum AJ 3170 TaxID=1404245 RepID=X5DNH7_9CORY|nr:acyl-CoA dehydrogenase family protein [Corynebacterium glyciniphilum]AHW64708.1 Glutaryl-CoA dehydrogenase [Corynebacterium glyciniphilum AJ 3170]
MSTAPTAPFDLIVVDSLLTDDERLLRDTVADFATRELAPNIAGWYEDGTLPVSDLAPKLGDLGVLGMHLEGYGCAGASATEYGLACMEIEAVDSGLRSLVSVQGSLAMFAIHHWGSEEQKEHYLPGMAAGSTVGCFGLTEPDAGSDPANMRTRATRDGDDWVLTGTKMWITNAPVADVAVVWARTEDGYAGFIVDTDTEGFSAPEITRKLSLRASVTGEIVLDGCRVPDARRLPHVHSLRGPLTCLNEARYGIIFGALGAARDALSTALGYVSTRQVFDSPLSSFQLTQAKLADMAVELDKSYLLALQLGRLKDAGELAPHQISVGKLNSTRVALEITRECRTLLGASGITLEYSPLRHANNLESVLTYEGTAEMHQLTIGQALTGEQAFRNRS